MSDFLKHECGIALIRLLKPISYYEEKYGTPSTGSTSSSPPSEKQHNRGQDGCGDRRKAQRRTRRVLHGGAQHEVELCLSYLSETASRSITNW